jgi:hypothetical protein
MHMHDMFGMIFHALAVAVIGFFVLFAAERASGIVKLVGTILGWLLWLLAIAGVVCAFICPGMGGKGPGWMDRMHGTPPAAEAPAKPDAAPATPAPATPKKP